MKTIAVVEDNADNRLLVRAILEERYDVVEYETGVEALESFASDPPDLVLLDISLPEMDGEQVLETMRKHERMKELPVIALTAHAMAGDREAFLSRGFDGYVSKPILEEETLFEAIRSGLARGGSAPEAEGT